MSKKKLTLLIIMFLMIVIFVVSLFVGSYHLSIRDIGQMMIGQGTDMVAQQVFFSLRVPRVVMALIAGLVLGVAGAVYQLIFANPLASPDITGVASGASLGAALAIVLGAGSAFEMVLGSFAMSLMTLLFVIILVKFAGGQRATSYILAGIVISALADAGIMIFKYMADPLGELAAIEFWTMGSLSAITFDKMFFVLISVFIPFLFVLLCHRQMIMLSLGDDNARYLGLNAQLFRAIILITTTWLVASVIAMTGVISFVGLIAPHIAYLILKKRTGYFLFVSGGIGSLIIMIGDMLARSLVPGAELPLSILTIFFSAPVLIFWMYQQRGRLL